MNKQAIKTAPSLRFRPMSVLKYALLTLAALAWIYPIVWMLSASFKTNTELFGDKLNLIPLTFTFDNIVRAWETANFSAYFFNTVYITFFTVIIVLLITLMMGYVVGRFHFRGKAAVLAVLGAAAFIPSGVQIIPLFQIIKTLGLANTRWGVIMAQAGTFSVMFIMLFSTSFAAIPKELYEAACIDGAGFVRTFASLMVPLVKPVIGSVTIIQAIWAWNEFLIPLVLTMNSSKLRTLAVGIMSLQGDLMMDWSGIMAGAAIALVPIMIVFICLQKYFVNGVAGAVKG